MFNSTKYATILLISCFYGNMLIAAECDPVTHLNVNDKSPCEGYLFTPAKEQEVRTQIEQCKIDQQELAITKQNGTTLQSDVATCQAAVKEEQSKAELWRTKAEDSTKKYIDEADSEGEHNLLYMLGGVLLTLAAGFALGQAALHSGR